MSAGEHPSFLESVAVAPLGDGRWRGIIGREWFGPPGPNGGFIAALMMRAIREEIGDETRLPRSLTLHYLLPPTEGEAEIEVIVEREGRSATTCSARMTQDGRTTTLCLCVLSRDFEPAKDWMPERPEAPEPEEVDALPSFDEAPPIFDQLDTRPVWGSRPFSGGPEPVVGGWMRSRGDEDMTSELVALYTDAWWPAAFSVLETFSPAPTLELTIHFRARPEPGDATALVRFRSDASIDGMVDERGEVWDRNGRLLAQSRQLALLRKLRT